jgi:hypothetical protein
MKNLALIDARYMRLLLVVVTLVLFVLGAAAPGSPGDIGIQSWFFGG